MTRWLKSILALCLALALTALTLTPTAGAQSERATERREAVAADSRPGRPDGSPASLLNAYSTIEELNAAKVFPGKGRGLETAPGALKHGEKAPPPVEGGSGHLYSFGGSNAYSGSMTGAYRVKSESITRYQAPGSVCSGPIYQPLWLPVNGPGLTWTEIGTAHWCDGTRSWYAFAAIDYTLARYQAGQSGFWYLNQPISGSTTHAFSLQRSTANCAVWAFVIDNYVMNQVNLGGCYVGTRLETGLESYTNWAVVAGPGTVSSEIHALLWNGASSYWWQKASPNYTRVDAPQMRLTTQIGANWVRACMNHDPC